MAMSTNTRVKWLLALIASLAVSVLVYFSLPGKPALLGWDAYKAAFLKSDGRIVDSGNQNATHSEGQGYGLLFAFHANDRASFQAIWHWTQTHLQIRQGDHLFAWRSLPERGVEDLNNASDGELLIAWALLLASEKWGNDAYRNAAQQILADVRAKLLRQWQGQTILLPGAHGFEHNGVFTVNLSYWVFPALRDFQRLAPAPEWQALEQSGLKLIEQARFGQWQLPPDWLELGELGENGEQLQPAKNRPPRFGYDAVRVPLHLVWADSANKALLQPFADFYQNAAKQTDHLPPWVDLVSGQLADYDAPQGMKSVAALLSHPPGKAQEPAANEDYYSASLVLLANLAATATE